MMRLCDRECSAALNGTFTSRPCPKAQGLAHHRKAEREHESQEMKRLQNVRHDMDVAFMSSSRLRSSAQDFKPVKIQV